MIKLRAAKVRKLFTSLFGKPRSTGQLNYSSNKGNDKKRLRRYHSKETLGYYDRYDHHDGMYCFGNDNVCVTNDVKSSCDPDDFRRRVGYKSRALDVNLGAVRGVLEAVNMTGNGRSNRTTSSCPSSIKSSPIRQGFAGDVVGSICAGENSIQAAIAHCKSSLGQSSDFPF